MSQEDTDARTATVTQSASVPTGARFAPVIAYGRGRGVRQRAAQTSPRVTRLSRQDQSVSGRQTPSGWAFRTLRNPSPFLAHVSPPGRRRFIGHSLLGCGPSGYQVVPTDRRGPSTNLEHQCRCRLYGCRSTRHRSRALREGRQWPTRCSKPHGSRPPGPTWSNVRTHA